ncbi:type III pantothenate kinase [Candidatus Saganbacteria bacterium]|nr:type III pantothenate kinase [Candidatus Saganbacteria bacterium]
MLLTVDLGNTNIVFGLFKGEKLVREWRYPTAAIRYPAIKTSIDKIIIASVVPECDSSLRRELYKRYGCLPHFVTAKNIPGLKIKLKKIKEIGADRVVDAYAALKLYGAPVIVVDFGTATTFDVVSAKGEYLGGVIAPGLSLSRDILHERTAKLPKVTIKAPRKVIGTDTVSALQSGLVYGYAAMVEGMIQRIKSEIRNPKFEINYKSQTLNSKITVIATGGLAALICKYTDVIDKIDQQLTLKGLQMIAHSCFSNEEKI